MTQRYRPCASVDVPDVAQPRPRSVRAWNGLGVLPVQPGELVAVGRTSDVYAFGVGAVVKVPRPSVPDGWAELEARFTMAISELDVPAPSVVDVVEVSGRSAIVFGRIEGRTMWQHMLDDPARIDELTRLLADLHRCIFSAGPPDGVDGFVGRTVRKIAEVDQITAAERSEAIDAVTALPKGAALLHGDLHPGNVLMSQDGPVAVDWFDASIGHPIADLVRSSLLMRPLATDGDSPHLPGADAATLRRVHDAYVAAMADVVVDVPPREVRRWEAVIAASRLAEGSQPDGAALLELWRRRDTIEGPLFEALSSVSPGR